MFTDRKARSIKPGDAALAAGVTGLTLQPTQTAGRGTWNLRFVSPATGRRRNMGLGVYPEIGVAAALESAKAARASIAAGKDPIEQRRQLEAIPTFEQAARERYEQVAPTFRNVKHRAQWISTLETYVFPGIGQTRVDKLTPRDFADALREVWTRAPETASRIKQRCRDVMAACWANGFTAANPLDVVDRLLPPRVAQVDAHQPAMAWRDVPAFVAQHLNTEPIIGARAALLFVILTAARSGEVRGATWGEIELDKRLWTVPAARMKAHRAHRVPLSDAAMELLQSLPRDTDSVFPSLRGGELSDMALTAILRDVNAPSDTADRIATAHGFRSSFRNWAADHGYDKELAERALAHTIGNKVQAAYERTDRLQARTAMMQRWGEFVSDREAPKVVSLRRGAA